jgi:hypothetical protein
MSSSLINVEVGYQFKNIVEIESEIAMNNRKESLGTLRFLAGDYY